MNILKLSRLNKTWIIDLDGTIFPHNGYLNGKPEKPLDGVLDFFRSIPQDDFVMIITTRGSEFRELTEYNLRNEGIRWNLLLMDMPSGERVLINDSKPSGLKTAYALCVERDTGLKDVQVEIEDNL